MRLIAIGWLFMFGVLAHNTEEALFLPAWSVHAGKWHPPVGERAFRVAAILLSAVFVCLTVFASLSRNGSMGAYLMAGYVLAMILNAFAPHVLATIFMRRYMPGTLTALLLNVPLGVIYLRQAFVQHNVRSEIFCWAAPLVVFALAASVPTLLAVGRQVT